MTRTKELQKGCGKEYKKDYFNICGEDLDYCDDKPNYVHLCPTCQAELKGITETKEKIIKLFKEDIKIWESDNKGKEKYSGTTGCVVKVLEELKAKLEKL